MSLFERRQIYCAGTGLESDTTYLKVGDDLAFEVEESTTDVCTQCGDDVYPVLVIPDYDYGHGQTYRICGNCLHDIATALRDFDAVKAALPIQKYFRPSAQAGALPWEGPEAAALKTSAPFEASGKDFICPDCGTRNRWGTVVPAISIPNQTEEEAAKWWKARAKGHCNGYKVVPYEQIGDQVTGGVTRCHFIWFRRDDHLYFKERT